jgi:hypothetical protein
LLSLQPALCVDLLRSNAALELLVFRLKLLQLLLKLLHLLLNLGRQSLLFRLANHHDAIVLGTGDLSELALGWATYGVGDHMSHYNVNASVPKTLIQHLIRWVAQGGIFGAAAKPVLLDILATEISPELVPSGAKGAGGDQPAQKTEDFVGPYALQDFHLYHITRFGFRPSKVAFLAWHAWRDAAAGAWPGKGLAALAWPDAVACPLMRS